MIASGPLMFLAAFFTRARKRFPQPVPPTVPPRPLKQSALAYSNPRRTYMSRSTGTWSYSNPCLVPIFDPSVSIGKVKNMLRPALFNKNFECELAKKS